MVEDVGFVDLSVEHTRYQNSGHYNLKADRQHGNAEADYSRFRS